MSDMQFILLVLILALATALTRFIPFLVFGGREKTPAFVDYLGKVLPAAMMGLLVVYCFKDMNIRDSGQVIPAIVATAAVAGLHLWKHNTIISIAVGTAVYMILIRVM